MSTDSFEPPGDTAQAVTMQPDRHQCNYSPEELREIAEDFKTSMEQYRAGETIDAREAIERLRERHGL